MCESGSAGEGIYKGLITDDLHVGYTCVIIKVIIKRE